MSMTHDPTENPPPRDELDALLRIWHEENAGRAGAGRTMLMARLGGEAVRAADDDIRSAGAGVLVGLGAAVRSRTLRAAASLAVFIGVLALLIPITSQPAFARQEIILLPDGGKLEARDARGQVIGPCALRHTDVHAEISGPFSRVTVKQRYHNPYAYKIEAVYTFPLSHRAAVDRMTMTVGDRIIEGEVKERQQARQMYESARQAGHVASLLEQERPNIFTQSVANIEPNAEVLIEISYVEMLQQRDGEYSFDFPMVVAPRYVPGSTASSLSAPRGVQPAQALPNELERREGVILLGPASFVRLKVDMQGAIDQGNLQFSRQPVGPAPYLQRIIDAATPILPPDGAYRQREDVQALYRANPNYDFEALYADGTRDFGQIAGDGLGHIAGRWFYFDPAILANVQRDAARDEFVFATDTNQVPDASRITPMPVRPSMRAGHDISLSISINTGAGGPAIVNWNSDLHEIIRTDPPSYRDLGNKVNLALKNQGEIPNRDFVLRWRCVDDSVREAVFTHADARWIDESDGKGGGFFTAVIAPPAKVAPAQVLPRELIFVLDTSGSMSGLPIDKAKAVMAKAIEAMRPGDTFNLITFAGDTRILWKSPRSNTDANRAEAQAFLEAQNGEGGTEMMTAINAALSPTAANANAGAAQALTPVELANLPADGREVVVKVDGRAVESHDDPEPTIDSTLIPVSERVSIRARWTKSLRQWLPKHQAADGRVTLRGTWSTIDGERIFEVADIVPALGDHGDVRPLRIVMFLTDGLVGNDDAIISAVRENSKTTRVFSFGIGDSPNRYLLDGVAQAGRGEATYVNLNNDPDAAVRAFARRIESPVLRDIEVTFSDGLDVFDMLPPADAIPDLWDVKPLIINGRYSAGGDEKAPSRSGKITIKGKTAQGEYVRVIDVSLPARDESNAMLPSLWARAKIDDVLARDDGVRREGIVQSAGEATRAQIIALGERYGITSAFTSFVAIEKTRLTIAGQAMLVPIPIEFPSGMNWEGVFGDANHRPADDVTRALLGEVRLLDHEQAVRLITLDQARRDVAATPEVAQQMQVMLVNELAQVDPTRTDLSRFVDFSKAPGLDLDRALNEGATRLPTPVEARKSLAAATDTPVLYTLGYGDLHLAQAQQQLDGFDPAAIERLGIEYKFGSYFSDAWKPQQEASRSYTGLSSGMADMMHEAILSTESTSLSWQAMNPVPSPPPPPPAPAGAGFGGGGGGAGSGGSIFGEAGDEPARVATPEEAQAHLLDIVTEVVNPGAWDFYGGDLATASLDGGVFRFRTLKDTPDATRTIDRARGLVTMLATAIPEIADIAKTDAPPSKPFDPAADIGDADATDQEPPHALLYVYDVRDLIDEVVRADQLSEEHATHRLMDLISEFIVPEAWDVNGGDRGRMQALKGNLIITIEPAQHREIERLLTQIRAAIAARPPGDKPIEAPVFKGDVATQPSEPEAVAKPSPIVVYDAQDLVQRIQAQTQPPVAKPQAIERLVEVIEKSVDAEGWRGAGGERGWLRVLADLFIIQNTAENQRDIAKLFGELRNPKSPGSQPNGQADQAKRDVEAQATIAAIKREDRLRRVIDERLRLRINEMNSAIQAKMLDKMDRAAIVILVDDADDAALMAQLTSFGLRVDDRHIALKLVAGEIDDVRKLVDVALVEDVRRIEPALAGK